MASPILLPFGNINLVKVSPVVVLSICDAYLRRKENAPRVIGTLLGTFTDGVVEVKSCFAVPVTEAYGENGLTEVKVEISHHKTMLDLRSKVNPNEIVVGWFASQISGNDSIIQDIYFKECGQGPSIYMVVDAGLDDRGVSAFVARRLVLDGKQVATEFIGLPTEVSTIELKRVDAAFSAEAQGRSTTADAAEPAAASKGKLLTLLHSALEHVQAVQSGARLSDPEAGRLLADALSLLPVLSRAEFDCLAKAHSQDALFLIFLADLLRTQIALAEKLGTSALPIM